MSVWLRWVMPALLAVTLPLVPAVPVWVTVLGAGCAVWVGLAALGRTALPGRGVQGVLGALVLVAALAQLGPRLFGPGAAGLLLALTWLKLLELRGQRDAQVLCLLALMLAVGGLLREASLTAFAAALGGVFAALAALRGCVTQAPGWSAVLGSAARGLALAAPPAAVLFLLLPRPPGPPALGGMGRSAQTGLRGDLRPGAIASLTQSEDVALRAAFDGGTPQRPWYWRGVVLWDCDGLRWKQGGHDGLSDPAPRPGPVRQDITLQPQDSKWLPALDRPVDAPSRATLRAGQVLEAEKRVRTRRRYRVRSDPELGRTPMSPALRDAALQVPDSPAPRVEELARTLENDADGERAVAQRAMRFFAERDFIYTTEPGVLDLEGFLFEARAGFCEHYAAAYALLMRISDIPARVVVGYHGGRWNELADHAVVRDANAHAWCEVWLDGRWRRADPSRVVERAEGLVMRGGDGARLTGDRAGAAIEGGVRSDGGGDGEDDAADEAAPGWESDVGRFYDAAAGRWERSVLAYGPQSQRRLLAALGLEGGGVGALWALLALGLAVCALLVIGVLRRDRLASDPLQRLWQRFCRHLARRGVPRAPEEPPRRYAERAAAALPAHADWIWAFVQRYERLRYGPEPVTRGRLISLRALFRRGSKSPKMRNGG